MDEDGSTEEASVTESYEVFLKIKEEPDPGMWFLVFSLVFIVIIPFLSFGEAWSSGDSSLCLGSFTIGFILLIVGAIQSSVQANRYKQATRNLAQIAGIPKKIAYPFFSWQAPDKRINSLVLQKYPFLSELKENATKNKPQKIVLSQSEEE